ncbi:MAG: peptidoglycan DD-metalloendopeptidase family protein [Alphaproteobacteria bacterium]|nr:peptidoglycan DD-metalloendopeptidase family protein [Alphaproteobacteria bacterium]
MAAGAPQASATEQGLACGSRFDLIRKCASLALLIVGALALAAGPGAHAQEGESILPAGPAEPPPMPESSSDRLERVQREIDATRGREAELNAKSAEIEAEIAALQRRTVAIAEDIQRTEENLTVLETDKSALERKAFETRAALDAKRHRMAEIIGILERMGRNPPPALLVRPEDATAAARGAMLMSAVMPVLEREATAMKEALAEMTRLREEIAGKAKALGEETEKLAGLRREIEQTLKERKQLLAENAASLSLEKARLRELASESASISGFIRRLEERRKPLDPGDPNAPILVLSDAAKEASLRFRSQKGSLIWPAAGDIVSTFQASANLGGRSEGIILSTRAGAQVVAPADGRVDFADVYRGYGNLLIISAGDGYHILIAGLARLDAAFGQWVIAGEPIGVMGPAPGQEDRAAASELYVEIQKDGKAIDPKPWFASRGKVSG